MPKTKYLTKSRFKLAHECPTKLYYTGKPEYSNENDNDEFLKALAEGGYQVGELAKLYYPGGTEPTERDYEKGHAVTKALIEGAVPSIYEGSLLFGNLYARVDVLNRIGKGKFELIEVKAKSFDPEEENPFWNKSALKKGRKEILSKWEPYLYDVAFQAYVARLAYPDYDFSPYLLLANTQAVASRDGLNQLFPVKRDSAGRLSAGVRAGTDPSELGNKLLIKVDVSEAVDFIINESQNGPERYTFKEYVEALAKIYDSNHRYSPDPGSKCKGCEFSAETTAQKSGKKSGFHECWKEAFKTTDAELEQPLVTELWNYRGSDIALHSGVFLLKDLPESQINLKESETGALTSSERQMLQLEMVKSGEDKIYADVRAIKNEMEKWVYPLHFIDFETTTVAIPFYKGQRSYESVAFQFSHHQMEKEGSYAHETEFLFSESGKFPNYEFVRALKKAVGPSGTIFRYSPHENSILNQIRAQLLHSNETDKSELIEFIETVTRQKSEDGKEIIREGNRCMVDLFDILKKYYYDPRTHGSNSLKYVFPAILSRSKFLQEKYSRPIYGAKDGIRSYNFKDKEWLTKDDQGEVKNPYRTLGPITDSYSFDETERLFSGSEIREGGSASLAFARMQFEEMSDVERAAIRSALLRYCELDTLAMVMLVEHWQEIT